jgi:hypothetical protein
MEMFMRVIGRTTRKKEKVNLCLKMVFVTREALRMILSRVMVLRYLKKIGTTYYPNGDRHEGEYKDNLRNGKGNMEYNNGDSSEGIWVNDKLIGHGICFKLNNSNLSQCKW